MYKVYALFILIIIFLGLKLLNLDFKEVKINDINFQIEIADTDQKKYKGLSGRNYLCDNCGMLFVFDDLKKRAFVMREMMMPIDIIYIKSDEVVDVYSNLEPEGEDYKNIYISSKPVNRVLEVKANTSELENIKIGDKVYFK